VSNSDLLEEQLAEFDAEPAGDPSFRLFGA
jgi:hypothetical protein